MSLADYLAERAAAAQPAPARPLEHHEHLRKTWCSSKTTQTLGWTPGTPGTPPERTKQTQADVAPAPAATAPTACPLARVAARCKLAWRRTLASAGHPRATRPPARPSPPAPKPRGSDRTRPSPRLVACPPLVAQLQRFPGLAGAPRKAPWRAPNQDAPRQWLRTVQRIPTPWEARSRPPIVRKAARVFGPPAASWRQHLNTPQAPKPTPRLRVPLGQPSKRMDNRAPYRHGVRTHQAPPEKGKSGE